MTNTLPEFMEKFRVSTLTILRTKHWTWSVRPVQCTLGAGILSLNRFCTQFGAVSPEETAELAECARTIEVKLRAEFAPDKFNYLMLMMVDSHVHFHVIPRYSSRRQFGGIQWADGGWPALPALGEGAAYEGHPVLLEIQTALAEPD